MRAINDDAFEEKMGSSSAFREPVRVEIRRQRRSLPLSEQAGDESAGSYPLSYFERLPFGRQAGWQRGVLRPRVGMDGLFLFSHH